MDEALERASGRRAMTAQERTEILQHLGRIWDAQPNLRLGQLIANRFNDHTDDVYYVEDYDLLNELDLFYRDVPRLPA